MSNLHGLNFIGNKTESGATKFHAINPSTSQAIEPEFAEATIAQVDAAMVLADAAFDAYRALEPKKRAAFLDAIAEQIAGCDEVIDRANQETGLPIERLRGERGRTVGQLKMFARLIEEGSWVDARIDHADPARTPIPKPDVRRMLIPMGPVVVFGASNFPLAFSVAGGDTASALAAGCPVVVKVHPGRSNLPDAQRRLFDAARPQPRGQYRAGEAPEDDGSWLHGVAARGSRAVRCGR